jgi:hypothetical protein
MRKFDDLEQYLLETLTKEQYDVLLMSYNDNSVTDIALKTDRSVLEVENILSSAFRSLRHPRKSLAPLDYLLH